MTQLRTTGVRWTACVLLVTAVALTGVGGYGTAGAAQGTADDTGTASVTAIGTAGSGSPAAPGTRRAADLATAGYVETEYAMTGDARIYSGPAPVRRRQRAGAAVQHAHHRACSVAPGRVQRSGDGRTVQHERCGRL